MNRSKKENGKNRRAVYLLPNFVTTLALFSGFYSVVASLNGEYKKAAVAILVAVLFDTLDGRIARLTRTASLFGTQYDSLSDLFSFGAAPALLMYTAVLKPLGRFGWLGAFLYLACGALRLARFNVQAQKVGEKHFTGLPIPAAASIIASGLLLMVSGDVRSDMMRLAMIPGIYVLSFLMISTIPYPSPKQVVLPNKRAFHVLAGQVLMLVLVASYPALFIFTFFMTYATLGPLIGPWILKRLGVVDEEEMESFTLEDEDVLEILDDTGEEVVARNGTQ